MAAICKVQSGTWVVLWRKKFVKSKINRNADYFMNRSGKWKRINNFNYLKRKIWNIWERKSKNEQEIFACNRMTEVTATSVTVAEIQIGLSIFMLQNYQLKSKRLIYCQSLLWEKFHLHNWSYLVVKYFRLPFYVIKYPSVWCMTAFPKGCVTTMLLMIPSPPAWACI